MKPRPTGLGWSAALLACGAASCLAGADQSPTFTQQTVMPQVKHLRTDLPDAELLLTPRLWRIGRSQSSGESRDTVSVILPGTSPLPPADSLHDLGFHIVLAPISP